MGARRPLSTLMVLTAIIQMLDAVINAFEGRWSLIPVVLVFAVAFLFGAARASGYPFWTLAAWRDAGGTVKLDNLELRWGGLGATATGTLALDRELQPIGGFSGAIEGYDRVLQALVVAGRLPAGDAGLAQLALTLLAKAGPDGRPQIATSFTIQNGQMFLGPARLGPAPRLAWK